MSRSVTRDGDHAVIRIPMKECHALRVALSPIRQGEPTATTTRELREALSKALARLEMRGK